MLCNIAPVAADPLAGVETARYAPPIMPQLTSRTELAGLARLLFIATLVIVIDVRVPTFDTIPDAIGGALVLYAMLRLRSIVRGANGMLQILVVLAVVALAAAVLETLAPLTGPLALLPLSQPVGAYVLAGLMGRLLAEREPELANRWHLTERLILWLGVVVATLGVLITLAEVNVQIETPFVLVLVVILAIPLGALLVALWRTAGAPLPQDEPTPAPDAA